MIDNQTNTWINAPEVARRLGLSRQAVHAMDAILAPEVTLTATGRKRKRYHAGHIARILAQRSRVVAEMDALLGGSR